MTWFKNKVRNFRACRAGIRLASAAVLILAVSSSAAMSPLATRDSAKAAHWTAFVHVSGPLDLAGPRHSGSLVLEAAGRLWVLSANGQVRGFAPKYMSSSGASSPSEPYIAQSPGGCFGKQTIYALRLTAGPGVVAVTSHTVRRLVHITSPGALHGITFDQIGNFGHRLLVTLTAAGKTTVDAIGCNGRVTAITRNAPRVEGGIAVAPTTFGRFAGDLIAPSEQLGKIFAITPHGKTLLVARSGLPRGHDIGVASEGFVPSGKRDALVADRLSPHSVHTGDDVVLRIRAAALKAAGVKAGDLLVASEGGALTDAIRCSFSGCKVRYVADGPSEAHVEGHIAFLASP